MTDKDQWWHDLTNEEQHAYLKAHPKSEKHLVTHRQKVDYHTKGMNDAKRKIDYLDEQIEKLQKSKKPNPFKLEKLYDKLSVVDEDYEAHRHGLKEHSAKLMEKPNSPSTPRYGDEHLDDDDPYKEEDMTDEDGKVNYKNMTNNVVTKFSKTNPNTIVREAMKAFSHDPKSQEALHAVYAHVKHGKPISKRELKDVGKIAAFAVLTGAGTVALGPVSSIYLAAHINDNYNHGKGLGPVVVDAVKDIEDADNEEDINEIVVKRMIENLQEQLLEAKTEESSSRIEHLLDTLEASLDHYSYSPKARRAKKSKKGH